MNKSKIVLAAIGGVTLVAALAAGFFLWQASNAKTAVLEGDFEEGTDGLDAVMQKAASLAGKAVFPSQESEKMFEANREKFDEWRAEALNLASRGDRKYQETTPAAFKEFLLNEAKRLSSLPGSANGCLIKPGFPFGPFKEFILDGKLPPEAKLPSLQRQWDDITFAIETLRTAGALEVTGLEIKAPAKPVEEKKAVGKKKRSSRRPAAGRKQQDETEKEEASCESYVLTFLARPAALVRTLNALSTCERFVTVEGFSFFKESDYLVEAISSNKKEASESVTKKRSSRSRSRRREAKEEEQKVETPRERALRMGIISDPSCDSPLTVSVTFSIRDFGTLSAEAEEEEKK